MDEMTQHNAALVEEVNAAISTDWNEFQPRRRSAAHFKTISSRPCPDEMVLKCAPS
ncbi:MAG: hypothetical protein MO852_00735 [Candidatus Devosia euplotis]|nr:hypothetical protein [Candidatus Devosia euplotis]